MANYSIRTSETAARERSAQEALRRGVGIAPGDVSKYWWSWRVHPTDGRAALEIPEGDEGALTEAERGELVAALFWVLG